jgi:two-component sensor histidine kinase/CheY-like chemotaxis protein
MINILHLEDNDDDAQLICAALSHEDVACHVTRVETRTAFVEAMDHGDWDIILSDYSLPSFNGISALKLAVEKRPELPFIFVTGSLGEELAVETLKNGATDFILKDRLSRLPQAVTRARRESESAKAQREAEQQLKDSLREKVLLLQEVHHRVNNNLQIICSLLSMQGGAINDPILASALGESQKRVRSMALIHAMLYASSSLKDIDFADYTRSLAAEVSSSYAPDPARVRLIFDLEPIRLEIDRAIPCGLILNEVLSNAFKYAFPRNRGGEVRVSLHQREYGVRMAVEDDGIGLPAGFTLKETKSLGLTIVDVLARQLGGRMEIASNGGAQFVLTFARTTGDR